MELRLEMLFTGSPQHGRSAMLGCMEARRATRTLFGMSGVLAKHVKKVRGKQQLTLLLGLTTKHYFWWKLNAALHQQFKRHGL